MLPWSTRALIARAALHLIGKQFESFRVTPNWLRLDYLGHIIAYYSCSGVVQTGAFSSTPSEVGRQQIIMERRVLRCYLISGED